ncbi:MAG TPA: hypothetical protein VK524_21180 [Polyangiaceae bacterium]|nr:hypothetical protein [Polyangiaceae bacterium]
MTPVLVLIFGLLGVGNQVLILLAMLLVVSAVLWGRLVFKQRSTTGADAALNLEQHAAESLRADRGRSKSDHDVLPAQPI